MKKINYAIYYQTLTASVLVAFIIILYIMDRTNNYEIDRLNKFIHYQDSIIRVAEYVDIKQDSIIDNMPEMLYHNPDAEWND